VFISVAGLPLQAQTITTFEKVEDYELPYPGILPDNPLYILKNLRNSIQLLMAQDALEKAKVNLQLSDKNISASLELTKKGKSKLAAETALKAEELFNRSVTIIEKGEETIKTEERKKFIDLLIKSNLKHRETLEFLLKNTPTGQVEQFEKLHQQNLELQKKIAVLQ
jgi:hypothetical protein